MPWSLDIELGGRDIQQVEKLILGSVLTVGEVYALKARPNPTWGDRILWYLVMICDYSMVQPIVTKPQLIDDFTHYIEVGEVNKAYYLSERERMKQLGIT